MPGFTGESLADNLYLQPHGSRELLLTLQNPTPVSPPLQTHPGITVSFPSSRLPSYLASAISIKGYQSNGFSSLSRFLSSLETMRFLTTGTRANCFYAPSRKHRPGTNGYARMLSRVQPGEVRGPAVSKTGRWKHMLMALHSFHTLP